MPTHRPLPYRYGDHPAQVCDLHLPDGPPRAVAAMVHGGYWRARYERSLQHAVAADLLAAGWAVWNLDYRAVGEGPSSGGGWPRTYADVGAGLDLLAVASAEHGLPLDRLGLLGHSAGGALALWAAGRHRLPDGAPGAAPVVRPAAVVAQAAVCDLVTGALAGLGSGAVVEMMGAGPGEDPDRYRQASAAALLPLGIPVLVVTGTDDEDVPAVQSEAFATAAEAAGDDVTLVLLPGEGHFGHLDPASPVWRVTADWLTARLLPEG